MTVENHALLSVQLAWNESSTAWLEYDVIFMGMCELPIYEGLYCRVDREYFRKYLARV